MLQVCNISKKYRKNTVLVDVSFEADNGCCIGILGSNGAGKSTLLSIIAGVLNADRGSVSYNGKNLLNDPLLRGSIVGYVPQGTPLIQELSAWDNLLLWYDRDSIKKELDNGVLKLLGVDKFIKTPVSKMSGGMKKRLSIGCAVSKRPPILLLDEPTAALDVVCKRDIAQYLQAYKNAGGIILLTTHDTTELSICDKCYIMKDGILHPYDYDGDVESLINQL